MGGAEFIRLRFGKMVWTARVRGRAAANRLPIAGSATRAFTPAFDGLGDRARFCPYLKVERRA
jgi:hypothetical protein